jgi:tetratricopeptide (TPR) repeat protein
MNGETLWESSGALQAIEGLGGSVGAVCRRGLAHLARSEHTDAQNTLREALHIDKHCAPAAALLAWTLSLSGDVEEAHRWSSKACSLAPRAAWPHIIQAALLKSWNRGESACDALGKALHRGANRQTHELRNRWLIEMEYAPINE